MSHSVTRKSGSQRKAPSRIRYEEAHPVVSFRITRQLYEKLRQHLRDTERSIGDFFREALKSQRTVAKRAYSKGYDEGSRDGRRWGFQEAKSRYLVTYPCSICRGLLEVASREAKNAAGQYMLDHGWGHKECHERQR